jgi:hypothetical protein
MVGMMELGMEAIMGDTVVTENIVNLGLLIKIKNRHIYRASIWIMLRNKQLQHLRDFTY